MTRKTITRKLLWIANIGLLIFLSVSFSIPWISEELKGMDHIKRRIESEPRISYTYTESDLNIDGTATGVGAHNWTWAESQPWCTGSGLEGDPYIIQDLMVHGLHYGIKINHSVAYFTIQNCEFSGQYSSSGDAGMVFQNVSNGIIQNVNCSDNIYVAVAISARCMNLTIRNCIFVNNTNQIIITTNSNGTIIENNYFDGSLSPAITQSFSSWTIIQNNFINGCVSGVSLTDANFTTIFNNTIKYMAYAGINFLRSEFNTVSYNTIFNSTEYSIILHHNSDDNIFLSNRIDIAWTYGIYIHYITAGCFRNQFFNNQISNTNYGLYIEQSSTNTKMENNTITNQSNAGIYATDTESMEILDNKISNCLHGINLYGAAKYAKIRRNQINNITENGIYLWPNADASIIEDNIINFTQSGLFIYSDANIVLKNWISDNLFGIRLVNAATSNSIHDNIIKDNRYGMDCAIGTQVNLVYENYFMNNLFSAQDNSSYNTWAQNGLGNFWSDYGYNDTIQDGIGDIPYTLNGTKARQDPFPIWNEKGPEIINPENVQIIEPTNTATVTWKATDNSTKNPVFNIYHNGNLTRSLQSWLSDNQTNVIYVDNLGLGVHTFIIEIFDRNDAVFGITPIKGLINTINITFTVSVIIDASKFQNDNEDQQNPPLDKVFEDGGWIFLIIGILAGFGGGYFAYYLRSRKKVIKSDQKSYHNSSESSTKTDLKSKDTKPKNKEAVKADSKQNEPPKISKK